ncbi:MAG: LLM class flavin-dependent oxidoreductase [Pseudomonadota bacterium]|nr:LLM class flavin-dependent oxidoreductase [Pseudomonadota bacterium]
MKFSFFMMPTHRPSENPTLAFHRDIDLIPYVESLGYDSFNIGEHHSGGWETMPSPEMALSMAAAKTGRIRLGTSVVNLPFHHPFHVAERMAFLDHLSYGRATLGIGPSSLVTDKKLFNIDSAPARRMMSESADIIVRLLEADEPISHNGEFWQFDGLWLQLKSYQQPRLPLALPTTGGAESLDLAARHDMELWTPCGLNRPGEGIFTEFWSNFEQACIRHGKVADRDKWHLVSNFYLADTREDAWADVREGVMRETGYFLSIGFKPLYESYKDQPVSEITAESAVERRDWLVGTPDDAIQWIEKKIAENGRFGGVMLTTHEWTSSEKLRRSLELFARYVIPHFNSGRYNYQAEAKALAKEVAEHGSVILDADGGTSNLLVK